MERKQFLKSLGMTGLMVPLIVSCSKDDESVLTPTISSFTPTSGATGTTVTITGTNFSTVTTNNTVTFNGTTATVTAASATQLTVTVPSGATTGKITVTVNGLTATSASDYTVTTSGTTSTTLSITSFTSSGAVGSSIVITGTNFSTTASENTVTINGVTATVTSATATQLVVTVPSGATSGTISVTVNGVTVTSSSSFTVSTASTSCTATDSETAGPFPTKSPSDLVKTDIRGDRTGVAFTIVITIENKNNSCTALEGALVDIWHCDKDGYYSEYGGTSMQTVDYTSVHFLRGRQTTNSDGKVSFTSIFPGWYQSRATHIHVHVYNSAGTSLLVTQIAFPEGSDSAVVLVNASTANGYTKGMSGYTYNASDSVFTDSLDNEVATVTGSVADGYVLTHTIVVSA
ncbi:MAG TPA: IPT/TIG domain-containing protein [Ohtaekwangia sp.]|uniref:IPT/TIG domain-containing protein n=1 Tax=Ohtaekwangia sp. TaxID=2066019 RepID=UPI002F91C48F